MTAQIEATLVEFVSAELLSGHQTVTPEDNLLADGMVDSLGMLRLVAFIEEHFGIKVPPDQFTIENFRNIDILSGYLSGLTGVSAVSSGDGSR